MIVVKVGGSVLGNIDSIAQDLKGRDFVLVHGIGPQMDEMQRKLGTEPSWYVSVSGIKCRYTDRETRDAFVQVSAGMNAQICSVLQKHGITSVGALTCLNAKRKNRIKVVENGRKRLIDGDYTGKIESVDVELLKSLLDNGYAPIIPPFAVSEGFELVNVNGDRAAARIAHALGADTIVNLSDIPGVLRNDKVIPNVKAGELEELREEVTGGMTMKLLSVKEAFEFGVGKVIIAPGNIDTPITSALEGRGTVFTNE